MEKFNTEISEILTTENSLDSQNGLQGDKENDPVFTSPHKDANDTGAANGELSQGAPVQTQIFNEPTNQSGENEGTKEIKNPKGAGRKPLTEEQRAERAKAKANGTQVNGDGVTKVPETKTEPKKDAQTSLMNDLSKYKNVTQGAANAINTPPNAQQIDLAKYVSGALLLICLDAIMPTVVLKIAAMIEPKYKRVKASKLKMTKEERDELEPLADEMVKLLFGFVHPAVAFLVATAVIYAGKLFTLEEKDFEPVIFKDKTNDNNSKLRKKETR